MNSSAEEREERVMSRSRLSEWIVPPVPALLLLFVLATVLWRG